MNIILFSEQTARRSSNNTYGLFLFLVFHMCKVSEFWFYFIDSVDSCREKKLIDLLRFHAWKKQNKKIPKENDELSGFNSVRRTDREIIKGKDILP